MGVMAQEFTTTVGDACCGMPGCQGEEVGQHYTDDSS